MRILETEIDNYEIAGFSRDEAAEIVETGMLASLAYDDQTKAELIKLKDQFLNHVIDREQLEVERKRLIERDRELYLAAAKERLAELANAQEKLSKSILKETE